VRHIVLVLVVFLVLERFVVGIGVGIVSTCSVGIAPRAARLEMLSGRFFFKSHLGLNPQAESLSPFGTKAQTPVHIFDSTSHRPIEDEDDYEYENQCPFQDDVSFASVPGVKNPGPES
jgi:hypothetical protein